MDRPIAVFAAAELDEHAEPEGHPERRGRLDASLAGIPAAGLADAVVLSEPRLASVDELVRVHDADLVERIRVHCASGGGNIDADTYAAPGSWKTARRAAGAVLDAVDVLERGDADVAFAGSRPPGHHAEAATAMGFCLFNNVAVAAAALVDRGERVAIVDWDVHHGNGTQDIFYSDPDVVFVSFHQFPWYPFTGRPDEIGERAGRGKTVNIAMPAGATGDTYRLAFNQIVEPVARRFDPTWVLVSAGFDGHRQDPLTDLGLTSADYADLIDTICDLVPPGRRLLFLEGGYDYEALAHTAGAVAGRMLDVDYRPEEPTSGGPGAEHVEAARAIHEQAESGSS